MSSPKPPVAASTIPSIKVLYELLGFQYASVRQKDEFQKAVSAWSKSFTASSGLRANEIGNWKNCQQELDEVVQKFLDHEGNGTRFWSPDRSWNHGFNHDSNLCYPKDRVLILELVKKFFWKKNYYAKHNSQYGYVRVPLESRAKSKEETITSKKEQANETIPAPQATNSPPTVMNGNGTELQEPDDIFEIPDDSDSLNQKISNKHPRPSNKAGGSSLGKRKKTKIHDESHSPRRTNRKRPLRKFPDMVHVSDEDLESLNDDKSDTQDGHPIASIESPQQRRNVELLAELIQQSSATRSAPTAQMRTPDDEFIIKLKMNNNEDIHASESSAVPQEASMYDSPCAPGIKKTPTFRASSEVDYTGLFDFPVAESDRNVRDESIESASHAEKVPQTAEESVPKFEIPIQDTQSPQVPSQAPSLQDPNTAHHSPPSIATSNPPQKPPQVTLWVITQKPRYTEEEWNGQLMGTTLSDFINEISNFTQKDHISEVKLTLQGPAGDTKMTVRKHEEDKWAVTKKRLHEKIKSANSEARARKQSAAFDIFMEPVYEETVQESGISQEIEEEFCF